MSKRKYRKVMCGRCGWIWRYKGKFYRQGKGVISCAHCHTTLELRKAIKRAVGRLVSKDYGYVAPTRWKVQQQIVLNKEKIRKMEEEKNEYKRDRS